MTTLILTPTPLELDTLEPLLSPSVRELDGWFELCGFGPVAAAARTMQLLAKHQPTQVILVGIAGGLQPSLAVGTARCFRRVACDGIGAGTGSSHKSAGEIGWKHWAPVSSAGSAGQTSLGDALPLAPQLVGPSELGGVLLTVCAASANTSDVAMRRERYPDASAEDMEGFGVAVACHFGDVPLQIIRGISNHAGDRDKNNWRIHQALNAASDLTLKILST